MARNEAATVLAGAILCFALGSVHAFSVFLAPLEAAHGASRASVSLIYSTALAAITISVLIGPVVWPRAGGAALALLAALLAGGGALIAGSASSLWAVWIGYGLLFGAANGFGYGLCLQLAAAATPGREGLSMGLVTAAYAMGAAIAPAGFGALLSAGGFEAAMSGLCAALAASGFIAFCLLSASGARMPRRSVREPEKAGLTRLWLGYGAGVAAGLMIFGHAAGILRAAGAEEALWLAPTLAGGANLIGSALGGRFADAAPVRAALAAPPLVGAFGLALAMAGGPAMTLAGLTVAGFAYGAVISCYPAVIAKTFGVAAGARVYGRVFTAWGAAGLAGPWAAGLIYDVTGGYGAALAVAAGLSGLSVLVGLNSARTLRIPG